ncbi:aspartate/glutamate racemase family protein [Gluconacetobacter sp. Hr-1-5]|uniref:aspartate/glutamate racemase family protein n=1 Tax=Gluconacetobacter sp. Hr-1-5 TaxID=3395370 RepID=UPI003B515DF7
MADMIARGGRAIYGVPLGILMLEARFPRIPGDMGNAETWPFPVQLCVVEGATPERIVLGDPRDQLDHFIRAGRRLIELGVSAITTNCGFLALLQPQLASALAVPVATSSLMQVPWVNATLPPGLRAGIVTVCAAALTPAHLAAVGAPADTPVAGTENGAEFFRVLIKADSDMMDIGLAERDVVEAARTLVCQNPDIGAIVLECTNMPPYAAAVAAATGLPVYDIYSMVTWFVAGIRPRAFSRDYSRL